MRRTLVIAGLALASLAAPALAQSVCDIHHLGYTQSQCNRCTNMVWSVSRIFPRGVCVGKPGIPIPPNPPPVAGACTPTRWGGATLSLSSPGFSKTGAAIGVCRNGYNLAKSQLRCSSGTPATALNYPNTNVTCSGAMGVGFNPQITIDGTPCCT